ncbi:TetR/AcrR family transcriptional regulator [Knoellia sp. CPCC 206453]|uniref:TetR/AcrR family transcriptional regulator n=1 Tax=Knoellia pratensis TaxID=3404796 RepID=UPI00361E5582
MASGSAVSRREQTARRISTCAQELAVEHGFDGFTLDELAEKVGVSRRTLFNYFPGKEAAVLNSPDCIEPDALEVFVAGGPEGHLLKDLGHLVVSLYTREEPTKDDWHRIHALFERNPRLISVAKERFGTMAAEVCLATETREGLPSGHRRARIAVALIAGIFQDTLTSFLTDEDGDFPTDFMAGVDEATRLLA